MKLSILIPVYNERPSLRSFWEMMKRAPVRSLDGITAVQIVVVDDGSNDGTAELLRELTAQPFRFETGLKAEVDFIASEENHGKGHAVRLALEASSGDYVVIQDSDLEYTPDDYPALLEPLTRGVADAVYGSRFSGNSRRVLLFWHSLANKILNVLCNVLLDLNLTDFGSGCKAFRGDFARSLKLTSKRFGIEAELTARIAHARARLYEVSVRYIGRTYDEGKKIRLTDGLAVPFHILRFSLFDREPFRPSIRQTLTALDSSSDQIYAPALHRAFEACETEKNWPSILEIGAGTGNLTKWLVGKGKVTATDLSPEFVHTLQRRFSYFDETKARVWDASQPAWKGAGNYDYIVAFNVLEHLEDDRGALKTWTSLLGENGKLIILVPHNQKFFCPLDTAVGHYRRYSRRELIEKAEAAGLTVRKSFYFNFLGVLGWWVNGILLQRSQLNEGSVKLYALVKRFIWPIERFLEQYYGLSVVIVAEPSVAVSTKKPKVRLRAAA